MNFVNFDIQMVDMVSGNDGFLIVLWQHIIFVVNERITPTNDKTVVQDRHDYQIVFLVGELIGLLGDDVGSQARKEGGFRGLDGR